MVAVYQEELEHEIMEVQLETGISMVPGVTKTVDFLRRAAATGNQRAGGLLARWYFSR